MSILRALRLALSILIIISVGTVLMHLIEVRPGFSSFNFFCYFTNQSNLLLAFFFILHELLRVCGRPLYRAFYDRTRGALILYMSMTSSIYWLFLHHLVHFTAPEAAAANVFLHSGALAFLLFDWIIDRPFTRLGKRFFVLTLLYPLLYAGVIMLLGRVRGWYPYPFLNIEKLGFQKWALWNGGMTLGIAAFALLIIFISNRLRREPLQYSERI